MSWLDGKKWLFVVPTTFLFLYYLSEKKGGNYSEFKNDRKKIAVVFLDLPNFDGDFTVKCRFHSGAWWVRDSTAVRCAFLLRRSAADSGWSKQLASAALSNFLQNRRNQVIFAFFLAPFLQNTLFLYTSNSDKKIIWPTCTFLRENCGNFEISIFKKWLVKRSFP